MKKQKKIYIAGPDVFSYNAKEIGERNKKICEEYGFIGLYPLDNDCSEEDGRPLSARIFEADVKQIEEADIVVANLTPFRGHCMDDGTAWEIGYAYAKSKKIYGYTADGRSLRNRIGTEDEHFFSVEDFGYPVNLMIAESVIRIVRGNFEDCIRLVSSHEKA